MLPRGEIGSKLELYFAQAEKSGDPTTSYYVEYSTHCHLVGCLSLILWVSVLIIMRMRGKIPCEWSQWLGSRVNMGVRWMAWLVMMLLLLLPGMIMGDYCFVEEVGYF